MVAAFGQRRIVAAVAAVGVDDGKAKFEQVGVAEDNDYGVVAVAARGAQDQDEGRIVDVWA